MIAVNGKGGTGKTTVTALVIAALASRSAGSILAIDADPNACLADALDAAGTDTIVDVCDGISRSIENIPAGMPKSRYMEMKVEEAIREDDKFDLLVMGRPEGPGCYCYANNLLRDMMKRVTGRYDFIVIDNAAGMEHISRRTAGNVDRLMLVSDYSVQGVMAAKKIYELARSLKIKVGRAGIVVNKVSGPVSAIDKGIKDTGLEFIGAIPYDEAVVRWGVSGDSVFKFDSKAVGDAIKNITDKITKKV